MNLVSKILAALVMGFIGLLLVGIQINLLIMGDGDRGSSVWGFVLPLGATLLIVFTARSARIAWGRLFLLNGLASLALPLVGMIWSAMGVKEIVKHTTFAAGGSYAAEAGVTAGAVLGGAMLTSAMAVVGFFLGAIFLAMAAFMLRGGAPAGPAT